MKRWHVGDRVRDPNRRSIAERIGVVKYVDPEGPTVLFADELVMYAGGSDVDLVRVRRRR